MESLHQDPALLQEFLVECEELLQETDQDLVELESAPGNDELLNRIFRALHTIKGTSGFLGLRPMVQLSHRAEDVLVSLRRREIQLTPRIMDALLATRDQLGEMLADIRNGGLNQYALDDLLTELEQVQTQPTPPFPLGELLVREGKLKPEQLAQILGTQTAAPGAKLGELVVQEGLASSEDAPMAQTMRVDVRKLDQVVDLIGELVLERNRLLQLAKEAFTFPTTRPTRSTSLQWTSPCCRWPKYLAPMCWVSKIVARRCEWFGAAGRNCAGAARDSMLTSLGFGKGYCMAGSIRQRHWRPGTSGKAFS